MLTERIKKLRTPLFIIGVLIILAIGVFLWQGIYLPRSELALLRGLPKDSRFSQGEPFFIDRGQSLFQIAEDLEKEGLIKNKFFFDLYIFIKGAQRKLQAGEYFLSPSESIARIAGKIISGDIAKVVVTIPEGFTVKQIEEKLNLKLPGENLEGFLFPDTYYLPVDVTPEKVVEIMTTNFDKKMAPFKEEIEGQGKTIFEIVIMASLLEKEVKTFEDKELVSGILWKRLENGMPLQVDATITYIKKTTNLEGPRSFSEKGEAYGSRISIEETKINSLFNTYKYLGLPPGPICNPGTDSIKAAIYPKNSDYWYYLSTPEGKTIFSKTLEEHNIAKEKYLR